MPPKHTPVKKTKAAGTSELETVSTAAGFTEEENAVMDKWFKAEVWLKKLHKKKWEQII